MNRILFYLSRYPGVGGIENVTTDIINELSSLGKYEIDILSHLQAETTRTVPNGIKIYSMPNSQYYNHKSNYNYAEQLLRTNKYSALIYQDSYAPTEKIVTSLSKKYSIPLYVFEHNSPLFIYSKRDLEPWYYSIKSFLRRPLHPYLLWKEIKRKSLLFKYCKKYILLSREFVPEFCQLIGIQENNDKVLFINNPIKNLDTPIDLSLKQKEILYVGRLVPEKRVDLILRLWEKLQIEYSDWKLTIVGDGECRKKLEKQAKRLKRVSFVGFQNPKPFYEKASIMLMTSKYEGWGMTLLEAMQYAVVPIAVNTFSSIYDIIDHQKNGIILNKDESIKEWKEKITELMESESLKEYQIAAMKKTLKFDIKIITQEWVKLLDAQVITN